MSFEKGKGGWGSGATIAYCQCVGLQVRSIGPSWVIEPAHGAWSIAKFISLGKVISIPGRSYNNKDMIMIIMIITTTTIIIISYLFP